MNQLLQEKRDAEHFLRLIAPKYTGFSLLIEIQIAFVMF